MGDFGQRVVRPELRAGTVVSVATAGDLALDGSLHSIPEWDAAALMRLFRERLLQRLLDRRAISDELVGKLLAWRHPGFRKQLIRSPRVRTLLAYGHARN